MDTNECTPFTDIYEYALTEINSDELRRDKQCNPALFYRKMFLYLQNGVPLFDTPMGISAEFTYERPEWKDLYLTLNEGQTEIDTGVTGYDIADISTEEEYLQSEYDSNTGRIVLKETVSSETEICIDFYKDGYFHRMLNHQEMYILGLCVGVAWFRHFSNSDVDIRPKIQDSSFKTSSEANDTNARTTRLNQLYDMLQLQMGSYARGIAFRNTVPQNRWGY